MSANTSTMIISRMSPATMYVTGSSFDCRLRPVGSAEHPATPRRTGLVEGGRDTDAVERR